MCNSLQLLLINPPPPKDSIGSLNLLPNPLELLLLPVLVGLFLCEGKVWDSVLLDDPTVSSKTLVAYLTTMMRAAGRLATIMPTVNSMTVQTATG